MCASQNVPIWQLTEQRLIIIIVQNLFCAITDYCVENGKADWVAGDDFAKKDGGGGLLMATMKVFARTSALGGREGTQWEGSCCSALASGDQRYGGLQQLI